MRPPAMSTAWSSSIASPVKTRAAARARRSVRAGGGMARRILTWAITQPIQTESANESSRDLDIWPSDRILTSLLAGQRQAIDAVEQALPAIETAAAASLPRLKRGGRLIYVGAGTSGRIGVQDGVELYPTFDWPWERLGFMIAGREPAFMRAVAGA